MIRKALWDTIHSSSDPYRDDLEVSLLNGSNYPRAIKPREVILGTSDDPYAIRTRLLSWGIIGPVNLSNKQKRKYLLQPNRCRGG